MNKKETKRNTTFYISNINSFSEKQLKVYNESLVFAQNFLSSKKLRSMILFSNDFMVNGKSSSFSFDIDLNAQERIKLIAKKFKKLPDKNNKKIQPDSLFFDFGLFDSIPNQKFLYGSILACINSFNPKEYIFAVLTPAFFYTRPAQEFVDKINKIGFNFIATLQIENYFDWDRGPLSFPLTLIVLSKKAQKKIFVGKLDSNSKNLIKNLNNKNDSKSLINGTFTDFEDFRGFEKLMDRRSYNEILKTFKKKNIPIFKFSSLVRKDREGNLLKRIHTSKPKEYYNNTIFFKRTGGKPFVDIKAEEKRFKKPFANVLSYELDSKKILSDYLLIVLTSTFSDKIINQYTTGITIPNLRPEFLENIEIAVPSIKNQKLIIKNDKDIKALKEYLSNSFENIYEDMNVAANDPEKIQENIKKIKTTFLKPTKSDEIKSLILQGEGNKIEFKQTFAMDIKDKKKKDYLVHEVIKNLLGFMNHQGGTVLVGVRDDGVITGINEEIKCEFQNSKDEFLKYFQNKIRDRIGVGLNPLIDHNIIRVDKKLIFKITAKVSDKLCYEKTTGDLYVRLPAGTKRLSAKEANDYAKSRDKNLPLNA